MSRSVIGSRRLLAGDGSPRGQVRVTIQCGCGFEITALGADDSHYDLFDAADRTLHEHLTTDEQAGVCRPWIAR